MADDALFWGGMAAAKREDYLRSIELFNRVAKEYPDSRRMAEARFAQADSLCELGRFAAAILVFEEIISKYPESDLIPSAWGRKGDCQFTLGSPDEPERWEESIDSYRVVANSSSAGLDLVLQAEYKIGRCLEKLARAKDALEHYYIRVIVRFLEEREKGAWLNDATKVWFTRAVFNSADVLESRKDWKRLISILERVVEAGVPAAEEARQRIEKIKSEHWWLF